MTAGNEKVVRVLVDMDEKEAELLPMLLLRLWLLLLLPCFFDADEEEGSMRTTGEERRLMLVLPSLHISPIQKAFAVPSSEAANTSSWS